MSDKIEVVVNLPKKSVPWSHRSLDKILILRMRADGETYTVLYVLGQFVGGELVTVDVPFRQLNKRTWKTDMLDIAKKHNVFLRDLNMFSAASIIKGFTKTATMAAASDESAQEENSDESAD